MLAALEPASLQDDNFIYEPKYDGIRALIEVRPGGPVTIRSRLGNDKTSQFPEIVHALKQYGRTLKAAVLLDGEIVALDQSGEPTGFQQLQGRIHLTGLRPDGAQKTSPVAFIAFDVLRDGAQDLTSLSLVARRARLKRIFGNTGSPLLRLSDFVAADGRALYRKALAHGWEGLIAKRADSPYRPGKRTPEWRKIKIVKRQDFVIGGWTEPRNTRSYFGALLLGVYDENRLIYVGHTGTGFDEAELDRLFRLMRSLETKECPFATRPRTNERPHWIQPKLVADVKFTEWTSDTKLRHPTYIGLRDDIVPQQVHREPTPRLHDIPPQKTRWAVAGSGATGLNPKEPRQSVEGSQTIQSVIKQLEAIEDGKGDGTLALPEGWTLAVGNLKKIFWPSGGITKGELLRYYAAISPILLPAVADRPLVMRRFPNGVKGKAFYQQRAPEDVPDGVRVEVIPADTEVPSRLVGGSLITLLYMTQLAVISQDPWFSRIQSPDFADYVAIDLDPMPGVKFSQILDVARWVRDELERVKAFSVPKTSGASGLHIYIPLPPKTSYETGRLFCQVIATLVARKHPKAATVVRAVHDRGRTVYLDYLQNIHGKTLATAYSARASDFAGVSTPLTWNEIDQRIAPEDFTLRTIQKRVRSVGDLWAPLRNSKGIDLEAVTKEMRRS
jgi:bifunctional non-homologous end joining protein LigD